tara:strand:+ start:175 stop:1173 length:999 start_codon:yes stop_codon:yes gene_type:complete
MPYSELGNVGLRNLGNTCYLNSIIQCLSHLLVFHPKNKNFMEECQNINNKSLIYEWLILQKYIWSNKSQNVIIEPKIFISRFIDDCNINDSFFESFEQNDASEFLIIFLNFLHKSIICGMDIVSKNKHENSEVQNIIDNSQKCWLRFYKNDYSYIVEKFHSQLLNFTTCTNCGYYTTNHDPIQIITLDIDNETKSLYDCLNNYTSEFTLDDNNMWTCDKCKIKVLTKKKTLLWKTSDIIIICLKKFNSSKFIEYPENLDLQQYNINFGTTKNNIYTLQSYIVHLGSINIGHYYSVCKNHVLDNWYKYDDDDITEYSDNYLNEKPYILFYKRS